MSEFIVEQNKQKAINDFLNAGMPKVTIERILLETSSLTNDKLYSITGVSGTSRVKDPHIRHSNLENITDQTANNLKVDITLSLQGFLKKDTKIGGRSSGLWFDNINLASLISVNVYQIDSVLQNVLFQQIPDQQSKKLNHPAAINYLVGAGGLPIEAKRTVNISEILFQADNSQKIKKDKAKFITTSQDGSIIYNLSHKLEAFSSLDPNPSFLAYVVVTSIDTAALRDEIINSITADLPTNGPALGDLINLSELENTISDMISQYSTQAISYDVVFNQKTVNDTAILLQREDNQNLWFGNFHTMPDGTIMTGLTHNDNSLSNENKNVILTPVKVANTKIVDLRDDEEIDKIFLQELYQIENVYDSLSRLNKQPIRKDNEIKQDKPNKYSYSMQTSHLDGSYSFIFGIDKAKILLNNSLYETIANYLSTLGTSPIHDDFLSSIMENIFAKTKIVNLSVYRKRVNLLNEDQNRLGTTKVDQGSFMPSQLNTNIENSYKDEVPKLIASYSDNGTSVSMRKVEKTGYDNLQKTLLTFKDNTFDAGSKGAYQYYYEISIEDGILTELENLFSEALQNFVFIKNYVHFIDGNLEKYYNEKLDIFNTSNIEIDYENPNDIDVNQMILACITSMRKVWTILGINNLTLAESEKKLLKIASPDTGNYQGLNKFFNLYNTFLEKMVNMLGFNKDVLSIKVELKNQDGNLIEFITPTAAFGTIEKLDSLSSGMNKFKGNYKNTISLKEVFPQIINVGEDYGTGYDFLISDVPPNNQTTVDIPVGSIDISSGVFRTRMEQEKSKYFQSATSDNAAGLDLNTWSMSYMSACRVHLNGSMKTINRLNFIDAPMIYPADLDFKFYKKAMLNILKFNILKQGSKTKDSFLLDNTYDHTKEMLKILSNYGISWRNKIFEEPTLLTPPSLSISDSQNFDPIESDEGPSAFSGPFTYDAVDDYEDSSLAYDLYAGKISFLLSNLFNKLVLKDSLLLLAYKEAINNIYSEDEIQKIPNSAKSLIINYNDQYTDSDDSIRFINLERPTFTKTSLSFETYGWWWFNYSNIVQVHYLSEVDSNCDLKWLPLKKDIYENAVSSGKSLICRLIRYSNKNFGITNNPFFDLPVFNEYFVINSSIASVNSADNEMESLISLPFMQSDLPTPALELAKTLTKMRNSLGTNIRADLITDDSIITSRNVDVFESSTATSTANREVATRNVSNRSSSGRQRDTSGQNSSY